MAAEVLAVCYPLRGAPDASSPGATMYDILAVGVNRGPGGAPLNYAEKDAEDIGRFFDGDLGPPEARVSVFAGNSASVVALELELLTIATRRPRYFTLYFSGHGNEEGVLATDGLLRYETLIQHVRMINAPHTMIVLDVCKAASYLDFLKEGRVAGLEGFTLSWLATLATATRGTRLVFSTGRSRNAGETHELQNGVFTHALLRALRRSRGDLDAGRFISDQRAFLATKLVLRKELSSKQTPVERGLTGDFPLALSQADEPIGHAHFSKAAISSKTVDVEFWLMERRHIETWVSWQLLNADGEQIAGGRDPVATDEGLSAFYGAIRCPHDAVASDLRSRLNCALHGWTRVEWVLSLEDEHRHILDVKVVPALYHWRV